MGSQFERTVPGVVLSVARAVASRLSRLVAVKRVGRMFPVGEVVGDCQGGAHADFRWRAVHLVQW